MGAHISLIGKVTLCSPDGWFCSRTEPRPKGAVERWVMPELDWFICATLCRSPQTAYIRQSRKTAGLFFPFGCGLSRCGPDKCLNSRQQKKANSFGTELGLFYQIRSGATS